MSFEINCFKSHILKSRKGKKLDMCGVGIQYYSIFDDCSDFDIYICLLFWGVNIKYDVVHMILNMRDYKGRGIL